MLTFIFLSIFVPNIFQAAAQGRSTQMYYVKMEIDEAVLDDMPRSFNISDLRIEDIEITTECKNETAEKKCECKSGYRWTEENVKSQTCTNMTSCNLPINSSHTCVSNTSVIIAGSATLKGSNYTNCLLGKDSDSYKSCHEELLKKMKTELSSLRGFDTLTITAFSVGSIIAHFQVSFANGINPTDLFSRSQTLAEKLDASLNLETTGMVIMTMPNTTVNYNHRAKIQCKFQSKLESLPGWTLKRDGKDFKITNGSEAEVTSDTMLSTVSIDRVNELWEGEYRCIYTERSNTTTISHKANDTLDVCLLPKIEAFTEPGFPLCNKDTDVHIMKVKCKIEKSSERYNVTWENATGTQSDGTQPDGDDMQTYTAEKIVGCARSAVENSVSCTFINECGKEQKKVFSIDVIYVGDAYCAAEGDWGNTKADYTAELKCKDKAGLRKRYCSSSGKWEDEKSSCVPEQLHYALERAKIADIGLGELEENVGEVFSRFGHVTKTEDINSTASIDTSVQVLDTLQNKITTIQNGTTVDDMLDSSSHLMNDSLKSSWAATLTEDNSTSLAGKYLQSVETLVKKANITGQSQRLNLAVDTCTNKECDTSVFKVNVSLKTSSNGTVKTAGFRHLEGYLPTNRNESEPNSYVISATKENETKDIQIIIDFPLFKQRPRNVFLQCVSWNHKSNKWTGIGCQWGGSSQPQRCTCTHLSSFSILMSKRPIEVRGLTVMTYVGLSVSVVSLVFCLLIEMVVWSEVVRTNTLYLRHTAHVNISLCLLVANCCFLASSKPKDTPEVWCKTFAVVKHFCYLSMFFWMLCLSTTLLHQAVFLFHKVSKKSYLRFSVIVGYVCPLLIVAITFLATEAGGTASYFSKDSCWLVYDGQLKGTIYTFIIPMGIIVFVNTFSMLVVIMKLLDHHQNAEASVDKEKAAAKTVLRSVIFLTPIFGVTWAFGFAVQAIDLTEGFVALAVNYIFNLLNAFQGFFILLTTCVADQRTREALLNRLRIKAPASISESTSKLDSSWKK